MNKYKLPEVEELKKQKFRTEYGTQKEFFQYANDFVNEHDDTLFKLFILNFKLKDYEDCIESDSCPANHIKDVNQRIERLEEGFIEKSDYRFVVHPRWKNDYHILIKAWYNRRWRFGLDSKAVLYFPKVFNVTPEESIKKTLLNELYRLIICKLPESTFKPLPPDQSTYKEDVDNLWKIFDPEPYKDNKVMYNIRLKQINSGIERLKDIRYDELFNKKMSEEERITRYYYRIKNYISFDEIYQTTSLVEKEKVIRYYLQTQSADVQKAKNTRGEGKHKEKQAKIVQYFSDYPNATISQAARDLKMSRNTVRKHKPN